MRVKIFKKWIKHNSNYLEILNLEFLIKVIWKYLNLFKKTLMNQKSNRKIIFNLHFTDTESITLISINKMWK